jgi:rhamnosyltransferase
MAQSENICGVVVTYHPTAEVGENLRAMVRECGSVLVVDNGSGAEACGRLAAVPGVILRPLGRNLGVAAALNLGAVWARENNFQWLVTFDQDSKPEPGLVAGLWAAHLRHPQAAVVGPSILEGGADRPEYRWVRRHPDRPWFFQRVACGGVDLPDVTLLITSGSMMELKVWQDLGGFAEELFVDYVDIDYCLRVVRAGRKIAVAAAARLQHELGARRAGRVLGRNFRPMHHAAFRHYYIARNRVLVWRRHARAVPHWALFDLSFAAYNTCRVLVFEAGKWTKLKAMLLGTWDGLRGRGGPCPEHRLRALQP